MGKKSEIINDIVRNEKEKKKTQPERDRYPSDFVLKKSTLASNLGWLQGLHRFRVHRSKNEKEIK